MISLSIYLISALGFLLILGGTIWLIVLSVKTGQTTNEKLLWTAVNLFCQPLGGIVFVIIKKVGVIPLIIIIIGTLMSLVAPAVLVLLPLIEQL